MEAPRAKAWVLVLMTLGALGGPVAHARDATSIAKQHFKAARELYKKAQFAEAAAEFKGAYAAKPHPSILFNVAECYEKLGETQSALQNYREYLKQLPEANDRGTVEASIRSLEAKLRETQLQPLQVNSAPQGAKLALDGQPEGQTPFTKNVKASTHTISLTLQGYEPVIKDVDTSAEQPTKVDIILREAQGANYATNPDGSVKYAPVGLARNGGVGHGRVWTWVALGVGAGALLGAAIVGAGAGSDANKLVQNGYHSPYEAQQLYDSATSKSHTSNALLGVGLVAVGAGTALFFVEGKF